MEEINILMIIYSYTITKTACWKGLKTLIYELSDFLALLPGCLKTPQWGVDGLEKVFIILSQIKPPCQISLCCKRPVLLILSVLHALVSKAVINNYNKHYSITIRLTLNSLHTNFKFYCLFMFSVLYSIYILVIKTSIM